MSSSPTVGSREPMESGSHGPGACVATCAMMQPSFLPWLGLFGLVLESDCFVFLDDFQFSLQSYHQRNRLFVDHGHVGWYTVPVRKAASYKAPLNETRVVEDGFWRSKMLKRIQANYSKAPFFSEVFPWVQSWLTAPSASLAAMNMAFIRGVCELMGLQTEFRRSSDRPSTLQRSDRVVDIVRWCAADCYLSARGSFDYMLTDRVFPIAGIQVLFQDFACVSYPQAGSPGDFVPCLSVVDGLMNVGPLETLELVRQGSERWFTWDEMVSGASVSGVTKDSRREEAPES